MFSILVVEDNENLNKMIYNKNVRHTWGCNGFDIMLEA